MPEKLIVTSALPYANGPIHFGHVIGAYLPADVYVRGFVTAYAQTIGLDPKIVVPSYMARVQGSRNSQERGRFLARR